MTTLSRDITLEGEDVEVILVYGIIPPHTVRNLLCGCGYSTGMQVVRAYEVLIRHLYYLYETNLFFV